MNLNEKLLGQGKIYNRRNNGFKPGCMGPPLSLSSKKKSSTLSSTVINWGKSQLSVLNSSPGVSKSSSVDSESRVILALTEGRGEAQCEVGLAALNISTATLILCQISDSSSYTNTLTKINVLNPDEIVIPASFTESAKKFRLTELIKEHFSDIKIVTLARSAFNKANGMERLQYLCFPELKSILLSLQHKYYALSAASAVLLYAQNTLYVFYTSDSLKLIYQESEGFSIIDFWTADRLELVSSTRPTQATKYSTLFGVLNKCLTRIGTRTLRSAILQPPCSIELIEERQRCVSELIRHPRMLLSIQAMLQKISNIDQLLTIASMFPNSEDNCSHKQLNYVLMLNSLLDLIEPLRDKFDKVKQPFFIELRNLLSGDDFNKIRNFIRESVHKEAYYVKGPAGDTQRCFIIKAGINGLLDMVRKTYSDRLEDMKAHVRELEQKYNLPLSLGNNNTKGYHIIMKLNKQKKYYFKLSDLPSEFIQVFRLSGSITMKTRELINLNTRIDDIMMDIIRISNLMIYQMLVEVKKYIGLFYKLCEAIAVLDMYQSLAQASIGSSYVKPTFGDVTEVRFSHHPMLDYLNSSRPIPNSFVSCHYLNCHIITGPNGSGKSILIRQIALLQIMAQVGCYIPAQSAIFRPADRIYARVYMDDNMECGASTLTLEMREIELIMTTMTDKSLVIIDELCRSTSVEEGTALAIAILEKLSISSAFIYLTTHYTLLAKMVDMYYNIKVWQMETDVTGNTPDEVVLNFKYRVIPNATTLQRYGVYLVRDIWPDKMVRDINRMINNLSISPNNINFLKLDIKLRLKYEIQATIMRLKLQGKLTMLKINMLLNSYVNRLEKLGLSIQLDVSPIEQELPPEYSGANDSISAAGTRMMQVFTPEDKNFIPHLNYDNLQNLPSGSNGCPQQYEGLSDDSSYRHLSEFLREDTENIKMLFPEVVLHSTSSSLIGDVDYMSCRGNEDSDFPPVNTENLHQRFTNFVDSSEDVSSINELKFSIPLLQNDMKKTSTPYAKQSRVSQNTGTVLLPELQSKLNVMPLDTSLPSNVVGIKNFTSISDKEISEAIDDLQSCSESFFEDDMEPVLDSSYHSACEQQNFTSATTLRNMNDINSQRQMIDGSTSNKIKGNIGNQQYAISDVDNYPSNYNISLLGNQEAFYRNGTDNMNKSSSNQEFLDKNTTYNTNHSFSHQNDIRNSSDDINYTTNQQQMFDTNSDNNKSHNNQVYFLNSTSNVHNDLSRQEPFNSSSNEMHTGNDNCSLLYSRQNSTSKVCNEVSRQEPFNSSSNKMHTEIDNCSHVIDNNSPELNVGICNQQKQQIFDHPLDKVKFDVDNKSSSNEFGAHSCGNDIDENIKRTQIIDSSSNNVNSNINTQKVFNTSNSNKMDECNSNRQKIHIISVHNTHIDLTRQRQFRGNSQITNNHNHMFNTTSNCLTGDFNNEQKALGTLDYGIKAQQERLNTDSSNGNNLNASSSDDNGLINCSSDDNNYDNSSSNGKNLDGSSLNHNNLVEGSLTGNNLLTGSSNCTNLKVLSSNSNTLIGVSSNGNNNGAKNQEYFSYDDSNKVNNSASNKQQDYDSDGPNNTYKSTKSNRELLSREDENTTKMSSSFHEGFYSPSDSLRAIQELNTNRSVVYKEKARHIFPNVIVIPGPNTKSISFGSEGEDVYYSFVSSEDEKPEETASNKTSELQGEVPREGAINLFNRDSEKNTEAKKIVQDNDTSLKKNNSLIVNVDNSVNKRTENVDTKEDITEGIVCRSKSNSDISILADRDNSEINKSGISEVMNNINSHNTIFQEIKMKEEDVHNNKNEKKFLGGVETDSPNANQGFTNKTNENGDDKISHSEKKSDSIRVNRNSSGSTQQHNCSITSNNISSNNKTNDKTSSSSVKDTSTSSEDQKVSCNKAMKRKFKPPVKVDSSATLSDDVRPCKKPKTNLKFMPQKKPTKREIAEELFKHKRILIEEAAKNPEESEEYYRRWLNYPKVSQVQNATILTHLHKTQEGIVEIPPLQKKPRKIKKPLPMLRMKSVESLDITIFSDKNAIPFEKFMNSNETDYKRFNFDLKKKEKFQIFPNQTIQSSRSTSLDFKSRKISKHESYSQLTISNMYTTTVMRNSPTNSLETNFVSLTPDGFYKQNKPEMEGLVKKYADRGFQKSFPAADCSQPKSVFEDTVSTEFIL